MRIGLYCSLRGLCECDPMDLQLPVQSVPITTKVVSLNPTHGEVYLMQRYMIKFVNDLRQVTGSLFSPGTLISSINKTECHDIKKIHNRIWLKYCQRL